MQCSPLRCCLSIHVNIIVQNYLSYVIMTLVDSNMKSSPVFFIMRIYISSEISIFLFVQGILYTICVSCLSSIKQVLICFLHHLLLIFLLACVAALAYCYFHRRSALTLNCFTLRWIFRFFHLMT